MEKNKSRIFQINIKIFFLRFLGKQQKMKV